MFTWICPQCGRENPPSYTDCPDCAERAKQAAAAAPPAAQAGTPAPQTQPMAAPPLPPPPPQPAQAPPPGAPPMYAQPVYQQPVYQQPGYAQPGYQQPVYPPPYGQPPYGQPVYPQPAPQQQQRQQGKQHGPLYSIGIGLLSALAFVGLIAGIYWIYGKYKGRGETTAPIALERPAPAGQSKPDHRFKDLEITGIRLYQDSAKKTEVRFLAVNHSGGELPDLTAKVTLNGTAGDFTFRLPSVGPYESREITTKLNTKLRVYELPDWQKIETQIEITSPQ